MKTSSGAVRASLAAALLTVSVPGLAQAVFDLPPGSPSATPRPAGPVDPDAPVVRPRPAQTAAAQPVPAASVAPTEAEPPPFSADRAPQRKAPAAVPTPRAASVTEPIPEPSAASVPALTATPTLSAAEPTRPKTPTVADKSSGWIAFATGVLVGALALTAAAGLMWRRRKAADEQALAFEPPVVPAPQPKPVAPTAQAEPPPTEPVAFALPDGLQIELEARRLDASLMATTLAYRLTLKNHGTTVLNDLAIQGDLIAAHSSLPVEKQIASAEQQLDLRHSLTALPPGEAAEFKGEMRLPLTAITPIRAGNAAYFVALARLRIEVEQATDRPLVLTQTFVVGELPEQPGGALRPFRLDLGPRTFGRLGQRAVG